jgi:hypothetical protein
VDQGTLTRDWGLQQVGPSHTRAAIERDCDMCSHRDEDIVADGWCDEVAAC